MDKLPDFVIIGVLKGGTTALHANLGKHPDISVSDPKELHFFGQNWAKGKAWYKSHFKAEDKICGEASPGYIYFTQNHQRMRATIPEAKLILLLRNPVDRAYSQWNHWKRNGIFGMKDKTFEEAIKLGIKNLCQKETVPPREDIIRRGFYVDQIEHLLQFYPRENLHIIISERIRKNAKDEYRKIYEFLGVRKNPRIKLEKDVFVGNYAGPMDKKTKKILRQLYRPYNERLYDFLGYRIKEWEKQHD